MTGTAKTKERDGTVVGGADDELLAKLDTGYPPAWIAENAGDVIAGAFLRLETGMTKFGPTPVVVVGTYEGERSVFLFYESLKTGFRRAQPVPGERIAIRYEGEKPVKNPSPGRSQTFHDYRVVVDRAATAGSVDWSAALGPDTTAPIAEQATGDDIPY